jgi:formyltetrahydrofolate deformylase
MIILIQCNDKVGLVANISNIIAGTGLNIIYMREHVEKAEARFFTRIEAEGNTDAVILQQQFQSALPDSADVRINPMPEKKIIVLVTKEYHCLGDILLRNHFKTLGATIQCVIGNYNILENVCNRFDIPFHYITHEDKSKTVFEERIFSVINRYAPDYLVLAKFMRILSPDFVQHFENRIINIHHSFLPAFSGAHPYRQAFERGVKLIGATSHFVTNNLDEGPIISQQIIPVTHAYTPLDMIRAGREIEMAVLARALQLVFDDKVMVYKNKTVVLE